MSSLRRRASAGVAVAMAGLLVAACTATTEPTAEPSGALSSPEGSSSGTPTATRPVTLRFAFHGDAPLRRAFEELAASFSRTRPEIRIELNESRTAAEAAERLALDTAAGTPPDVFVSDGDHVPALVAAGQVQPLDQLMEERGLAFGDSYQRLGLEALSAEQALQCMPYDVSPLVVFYHPGLVPFRRLIEPGEEPLTPETGWTWAQFGRAARLVAGDGVKGAFVPPELTTLMALVRSAGDDVVDDPREATTLTLSDNGTRAALEEILGVVRDRRVTPSRQQLAGRDALRRFTHEKLAMLVGTRALVPELRRVPELDFDVFPLPRLARPVTVAEVGALCISAGTERAEAAADFVAYASQDDGAAILAESGAVVPAHLPTLNSPSFVQPTEPPTSVQVFDEAVRRATTNPFVPGWPALEDAVQPDIERMWHEPVLDLDTLLPEIDATSQRVLQVTPQD